MAIAIPDDYKEQIDSILRLSFRVFQYLWKTFGVDEESIPNNPETEIVKECWDSECVAKIATHCIFYQLRNRDKLKELWDQFSDNLTQRAGVCIYGATLFFISIGKFSFPSEKKELYFFSIVLFVEASLYCLTSQRPRANPQKTLLGFQNKTEELQAFYMFWCTHFTQLLANDFVAAGGFAFLMEDVNVSNISGMICFLATNRTRTPEGVLYGTPGIWEEFMKLDFDEDRSEMTSYETSVPPNPQALDLTPSLLTEEPNSEIPLLLNPNPFQEAKNLLGVPDIESPTHSIEVLGETSEGQEPGRSIPEEEASPDSNIEPISQTPDTQPVGSSVIPLTDQVIEQCANPGNQPIEIVLLSSPSSTAQSSRAATESSDSEDEVQVLLPLETGSAIISMRFCVRLFQYLWKRFGVEETIFDIPPRHAEDFNEAYVAKFANYVALYQIYNREIFRHYWDQFKGLDSKSIRFYPSMMLLIFRDEYNFPRDKKQNFFFSIAVWVEASLYFRDPWRAQVDPKDRLLHLPEEKKELLQFFKIWWTFFNNSLSQDYIAAGGFRTLQRIANKTLALNKVLKGFFCFFKVGYDKQNILNMFLKWCECYERHSSKKLNLKKFALTPNLSSRNTNTDPLFLNSLNLRRFRRTDTDYTENVSDLNKENVNRVCQEQQLRTSTEEGLPSSSELVVPNPDCQLVVPNPDCQLVVPNPDCRLVVPNPDCRLVVPNPDCQLVVPDPDCQLVVPDPDCELVVPDPDCELVVPNPDCELVVPNPDCRLVVPDPDCQLVVPNPDCQLVVPNPDCQQPGGSAPESPLRRKSPLRESVTKSTLQTKKQKNEM